jgi:hypothetical protein
MKRNVVWGILVGIGLVVLSTTVAQASGGGTISPPLTSFFVCNASSGNAPGPVVDVESPLFGNRQKVKIGNVTFACAFARLFPGGSTTHIPCPPPPTPPTPGCNEIAPNPPPPSPSGEQLKCYTISLPRQTGSTPPTYYNTDDELVGEDTVKSTNMQFICAPASFTQ